MTHHSHSRRSQNVLRSQDCVIGDIGEHVPHNYCDHGHNDSQGDISARKGKKDLQRTSCYPLLCTILQMQLASVQLTHKLISSHTAFGKATVPQRLVTQDDFFPALPFRSDQLFTHKARLKPAWCEETGREFEACLGHQSVAPEAPSCHTYQPEYANMPA